MAVTAFSGSDSFDEKKQLRVDCEYVEWTWANLGHGERI